MDTRQAVFDELDSQTGRVAAVVSQGKTGTTTVAAALARAGVGSLIRTHTLRPKRLAERAVLYAHDPHHLRYIWEAEWLASHPPTETRPWSIVTSVRDPIARFVSAFFQAMEAPGARGVGTSADDLLSELGTRFERQMARSETAEVDWFDVNIAGVVGVDVYGHPFDPSRGWGRITTGSVDLLVLRRESIDEGSSQLGSVFGVDLPRSLPAENVAKDKGYAELYRAVVEGFNPPAELVDRAYDQRLARHFYSAMELEGVRRRWSTSAA